MLLMVTSPLFAKAELVQTLAENTEPYGRQFDPVDNKSEHMNHPQPEPNRKSQCAVAAW